MEKRLVDLCKRAYELIIRNGSKISDDETKFLTDLHKHISTDTDPTFTKVVDDITAVATTKTFIKRK